MKNTYQYGHQYEYSDGGDRDMSGGCEEREEYGVRATWGWMECTRARIFDAYDVCLFSPISASVSAAVREKPHTTSSMVPPPPSGAGGFSGHDDGRWG